MKNFLIEPLFKMDHYKKIKNTIENSHYPVLSHGLISQSLSHLVVGLNNDLNRQILIITYEDMTARELKDNINNLGAENIYEFPNIIRNYYDIEAQTRDDINKRLEIMAKLSAGEDIIVVANVKSLFDKLIDIDTFKLNSIKINIGDFLDLDEFREKLIASGYEYSHMVEGKGQFSIRGGIVDFYPSDSENAIRVEFFGDEIDSIREFDIYSQRSVKNLEEININPSEQIIILEEFKADLIKNIERDLKRTSKKLEGEVLEKLTAKFNKLIEDIKTDQYISNINLLIPYINEAYLSSIVDYFNKDALLIVTEPNRVDLELEKIEAESFEELNNLFEIGEVLEEFKNEKINKLVFEELIADRYLFENMSILTTRSKRKYKDIISVSSRQSPSFYNQLDFFKSELNRLLDNDYKIIITGGTDDRAKRIAEMLDEMEIRNSFSDEGEVLITTGSLTEGFEYPEEKFIIINDSDIFGRGKRPKKRRSAKKTIENFSDLEKGDFIVHENHGIGIYQGIVSLDIQGVKKDYLDIKYKGQDKLYVAIDQLNLIDKYIGSNDVKPKLHGLSSGEWAKTKAKAKAAVEEMAEELIELYAIRENTQGFKFEEDSQWQIKFEDYFPYQDTEGQRQATKEIKADMESNKVMDRLLCADVGYGKTEVALRAAFKAVLSGKQVAFLVPTTILAEQHYNTMRERFREFPVEIESLSRFKTDKEAKEIIRKLKTGAIDIIVGTHRLLSKDIVFSDLGLLIIDEEQRFGVKAKEQIKTIKETVDVLTLTATPIPRTLHMSLSGIRDMSVLEDPPEERFPIQTFVMEKNDALIREAILKEMARGGQVYFIHNRVCSINSVKRHLEEIVPEAEIIVAHGQLSENVLEKRMLDFVENKADVLLSTTIIETGLDIPNVNTIIVDKADNLGLSQLYQLRGRVGRSNRIAYGYFLHDERKVLTEIAQKRLVAIKEFTDFGSGFKIALRDLEIRGAGNLLGERQHGQIAAIGYDLYVRILNETINEIKGKEPEKLSDTIVDLEIDGFIADELINDERQRLDIYKKIGAVDNEESHSDMIDELYDRFPEVNDEAMNLIDISLIRNIGAKNNIKSIIQNENKVRFYFDREEDIDPDLILSLSEKYGRKIKFILQKNPNFLLNIEKDTILEVKNIIEDIDNFNKERLEDEEN